MFQWFEKFTWWKGALCQQWYGEQLDAEMSCFYLIYPRFKFYALLIWKLFEEKTSFSCLKKSIFQQAILCDKVHSSGIAEDCLRQYPHIYDIYGTCNHACLKFHKRKFFAFSFVCPTKKYTLFKLLELRKSFIWLTPRKSGFFVFALVWVE